MKATWMMGAAVAAMSAWTANARGQDVPMPETPAEPSPPKQQPKTTAPKPSTPASPEPEAGPETPAGDEQPEAPAPEDQPAPPAPDAEPEAPAAAPPAPEAPPAAPPQTPGAPRAPTPIDAAPPTPGIYVHIDADQSDIVLERHDGRNDRAKRGWHVVCHAPCDQPIEATPEADFRFNGDSTRASGKFKLQGRHNSFDVEAGSSGQWAGGWVAVGVGGAAVIAGAVVVATTFPTYQDAFGRQGDDEITERRTFGGVMMGVGLGIGLGLGLPLLLTSRTQYEIVDQRAWLELRPDGVAVSF